jgi:hypothetical protein
MLFVEFIIIRYFSCFPHFSKTSSVRLDFTGIDFENGCPGAIFGVCFCGKRKIYREAYQYKLYPNQGEGTV